MSLVQLLRTIAGNGSVPNLDDLARYIYGCLLAHGYGCESPVTFQWKFKSHTLSITLDNRDIKSLS
jgi:hypothetical protein